MGTTRRRGGHTASSSSSSSSSSFSSKSAITSPVLANSSFFSLDYFAPPNSPTSAIQAIIRNPTHTRVVQVASYTDNPMMSFPSIHPFIYTSPEIPSSPAMTSTSPESPRSPASPGASSISGSDYHGIGLAAMTASPGPGSSPSPSPEPHLPRVLGSPTSDPTDTEASPTIDGSKSRLPVQRAIVQFPQPKIINYARPFRRQQQQQQQQQAQDEQAQASAPTSVPIPSPSLPKSASSPADPVRSPDFAAAPITNEAFQLPSPEIMTLLGTSTQRQKRLRHKSPTLSPTSTLSSNGPITPHETPELDQDVAVVPGVPTWTSGAEGKGLGIDKVQQGESGVTWIEPVITDSELATETETESQAEDPTPKASDTRRQAVFDPTPAHDENATRRTPSEAIEVDQEDEPEHDQEEQTPRYQYRDSAFVATAMILEHYEDPPDCPTRSRTATSSSATSSVSGDMSNAFEYSSLLSSSSMASLDSVPCTAAEVRDLRQFAEDVMNEMRNLPRSNEYAARPSTSTGSSPEATSRSVSGSANANSNGNGSKIKRKAVPVFFDLELDEQASTSHDTVDLDATPTQRAVYGVRAAAQSIPIVVPSGETLSRMFSESTSSNSLSSIMTTASSSESQTQLRTPLSASAPLPELPNPHTSISSEVSGTVYIASTPIHVSAPVPIKHVPREFHVNVPISESAPAAFGGGKRSEMITTGAYMTRREAAEMREREREQEQEEKDKAAKVSGASIRRTFGKMFRSVS